MSIDLTNIIINSIPTILVIGIGLIKLYGDIREIKTEVNFLKQQINKKL
jgi:hypothetical protein